MQIIFIIASNVSLVLTVNFLMILAMTIPQIYTKNNILAKLTASILGLFHGKWFNFRNLLQLTSLDFDEI